MKIKRYVSTVARRLRPVGGFFKTTIDEWSEDKALRHAAALAYYSIFAMAPLLVITIAVAGFFFGEQAVEGEIVTQLQDFIGTEGAVFIENMLREVRATGTGLWPTVISLATMLFGALVIFAALQDVLNMIWGVQPDPDTGIVYVLRRRVLAFLMILCFGLLMMGAFLISATLTFAQAYWMEWFGTDLDVWGFADQLVWLVFFTAIFGVMYKLLPDVKMAWKDVWAGAFMTSLLFTVGIFGISTYIAYSGVGTVFGAAGTLAILLVWIYYSWVIVLIGAEMTQVWARKFGSGIRPGRHATLRIAATRNVKGRVTASGVVLDEDMNRESDMPEESKEEADDELKSKEPQVYDVENRKDDQQKTIK